MLYRDAAAAAPRTFVNLDMEEYRDLPLTLAALHRVLDEPEFAGARRGRGAAGVPARLARRVRVDCARGPSLVTLAAGGTLKIRVVKGANLAMERVEAELHGWPQAPYPTKAEVDASFKRLVERALRPTLGGRRPRRLRQPQPVRRRVGDGPAGTRPASTSRCSRAWRRPSRATVRAGRRVTCCCTRRSCGPTTWPRASPTSLAGSTRTPRPTTSCGRCSRCGRARRSGTSSATASTAAMAAMARWSRRAGARRTDPLPVVRRSPTLDVVRERADTDWTQAANRSGSPRSCRPTGEPAGRSR